MGTHSTLPSTIIPPTQVPHAPAPDSRSQKYVSLSLYLERHPSLVGKQVLEHFPPSEGGTAGEASRTSGGAELPFLFKVLSIGKALSIQAHPDKTLAKRLHAEKPKMYKDGNHKPEMAIALTQFKGFCGFRPLDEIANYLAKVPELQALVKPSSEFLSSLSSCAGQLRTDRNAVCDEDKKRLLQTIFSQLMEAQPAEVKTAVETICRRYKTHLDGRSGGKPLEVDDKLAQLVCTLNQQFPGDVGVFCSFVLNVMEMEAGSAMFLMANEPHAYLEGDIVECMAASDNVVRAGLTPKARDVQVLVDMLTYSDAPKEEKVMKPTAFLPDPASENYSKYREFTGSEKALGRVPTLLFDPPIEEFAVLMTRLTKGQPSELQRGLRGPSILIVTSGTGTLTSVPSPEAQSEERHFALSKPGQVYFVGAETKIQLQAGEENLVVFRAFVEVG